MPSANPAGRRLAILDRDGTINADRHYLGDPAGLELLPGVVSGLKALALAGYVLTIATNQSGVARGYFTAAQAGAVNARLLDMLAANGVSIAALAMCPHGPDEGCACRKPAPGMAHELAARTHLDLVGAVVIGDKQSDIAMARAIGARSILITPDAARAPDFKQDAAARDLAQAAPIAAAWTTKPADSAIAANRQAAEQE